MKLLKLTDPQGNDVWIVGRWVTKVQSPARGQYPQGTQAVISMGARDQAVMESVEDVVRSVEEMD